MKFLRYAFTLFITLSSACGGSPPPGDVPPRAVSPGCDKPAAELTGGVQVVLDMGVQAGGERSFFLTLPEGYDPHEPHKLIIAYPGTNWLGEQVRGYFDFERLAQANEIFVYPDPLWRDFGAWGVLGGWLLGPHASNAAGDEDLIFAEALIDRLSDDYCIDPQRVFATGHSWGGDMAMVAGCFIGDRLRAAAPAAANRPYWFETSDGGWIDCRGETDMWVFFGRDDRHFSSQAYPGEFGDEGKDFWLRTRSCGPPGTPVDLPMSLLAGECVEFDGCSAGVRYCLYSEETGHQIPEYFSAEVLTYFRQF